ncbi:non-ribosomal peptide synthetase [Sodalis sp. RH19]|uniref:non-ribosomal peptide synthetase n=1 Tax=Sodalis sp. RH19 TaxID=3394334 RepID=UPI0039B54229
MHFIHAFEAAAKRTPQAIALVVNDQSISYARLQHMAGHYAQQLAHKMDAKTDGILLCLPRGVELMASLLACHYLGVPYIPLDICTAPGRVMKILAASSCLLTYDSRAGHIGGADGADVATFSAVAQIKPVPAENPAPAAYRIYTSGSTGEPKGVSVAHRGCSNLINSFSRLLEAGGETRWLSATSVSFDMFYLEYAVPLANGGTLFLLDDAQTHSVQEIAWQLMRCQPDIFQSTPSMLKCLLPYLQDDWRFNRLLVGGEPLGRQLSARLSARARWLCNLYGPTETTVWSTAHVITRAGDNRIGRPIDHTQIKILDDARREMKAGEPGNIFIGGAGVALEYLNNPALTAEKFIALPGEQTEGRFYDTGDIGLIDAEGVLNYLYRDGDFYKVSGYRIDCAEVVDALEKCAGVAAAAVVVLEGDGDDESVIVGWLKMDKPGQGIDTGAIRQELENELGHYMIPRYFYPIDDLPYSISGKLDKKALITMTKTKIKEMEHIVMGQKNAPGKDALNHPLIDILGHYINIDGMSLNDNFFHRGLSSIQLVSFHLELKQLYPDINFHDLCARPTINLLLAPYH